MANDEGRVRDASPFQRQNRGDKNRADDQDRICYSDRMTNIDQFESVFKSADKVQFELEPVEFEHALFVTDIDLDASTSFSERVGGYLDVLCDLSRQQKSYASREDYDTVSSLLQRIADLGPDLVVTYRNLNVPAGEYPYSLGMYLDVLTQATKLPILVFPEPTSDWEPSSPALSQVMAMTDHITKENHLINIAARCTRPGGNLWLTHVEDEATLQRYLKIIGKIPELDTDVAREAIPKQLLKESHDYIHSCREQLLAAGFKLTIEEEINVGHHLSDYRRLVDAHDVDLLVMNAKDDDQLAMHGQAYPLTIEFRKLPILLL